MSRLRYAQIGVSDQDTFFHSVHLLVQEGLLDPVAFSEIDDRPDIVTAFESLGMRRYADHNTMMACENSLDIVSIATPPHTHFTAAETALEQGIHVFLDKPPVLRIQDLRRLISLAAQQDVLCVVNYENIAHAPVVTLKRLLCEGEIGQINSIKVSARQQYPETWYTRAPWAGKGRDENTCILDGTTHTAMAHIVNLALFLAGAEPYEFAKPVRVQAEHYKAAPMAFEDIAIIRAHTDSNMDLYAFLTLSAETDHPLVIRIEGEKGYAEYIQGLHIKISGKVLNETEEIPTETLLRRLVEVALDSDEPLIMPLAEAEGSLLLANGALASSGRIHRLPDKIVEKRHTLTGMGYVVRGLDDLAVSALKEGQVFSEMEVPWAHATEEINLIHFESFSEFFCFD